MFSNCARRRTDGSRWCFLFFDDAVLLCFACVEMLSAMELLHWRDAFTSSTLRIWRKPRTKVSLSQLQLFPEHPILNRINIFLAQNLDFFWKMKINRKKSKKYWFCFWFFYWFGLWFFGGCLFDVLMMCWSLHACMLVSAAFGLLHVLEVNNFDCTQVVERFWEI